MQKERSLLSKTENPALALGRKTNVFFAWSKYANVASFTKTTTAWSMEPFPIIRV